MKVYSTSLPHGKFEVYNEKPDLEVIRVKQTHSKIVLDSSQLILSSDLIEADGITGNDPLPKAILTADCLPIVLLGEEGHAIIHAGWRGLANGILESEALTKLKPFYAFIGPHISVNHYEVQADFKANFPIERKAFLEKNGKIFFNLLLMTENYLKERYPSIKIEHANECTYSNESLHSYRRNQTTKRNWNIFIPQ